MYGRPGVVFPLHDRAGQLVGLNRQHTDGRDDPKTHTVGDRRLGVFAPPRAQASDACPADFALVPAATASVWPAASASTRAPLAS
jgi:hypothetical protein